MIDATSLISSIPLGALVAAIVGTIVIVLLCCCCCCKHSKGTSSSAVGVGYADSHDRLFYLHGHTNPDTSITIEDLESCDEGTLVELDTRDSERDHSFPLLVVSNVYHQTRSLATLPYKFHSFINNKVIPLFKDQRASGQYQFAVLLLLSEEDLADIHSTAFTPSNHPLTDKQYTSMPREDDLASFGNYIVARPGPGNGWHSEEEIFNRKWYSSSPFSRLWDAYVKSRGTHPKCIMLYSWNLPCSRCTDVIIRSLKDDPYKRISVIVAHTTCWKWSESDSQRRENAAKLAKENIKVEHVNNPITISKAA